MRLLVFQRIACEHPGIFRKFLAEDGIAWDAVELDEGDSIPDLEAYDAALGHGRPDGRLGPRGEPLAGSTTAFCGWRRNRSPSRRLASAAMRPFEV